ncbi:hypothetical protein [Hymenobacter jejuensis]|uniref:Uncharacterized protein n=1 Tax=Hymenobacter jejuensis TaxID=2502781 RepID=A0A5B8A1A9_9BACT|nr:hypothetical protein [Hymenobacter jejuensis]QDA60899.1 hypothetical protein FHG12_12640 [Hymenobacter jejuensis]
MENDKSTEGSQPAQAPKNAEPQVGDGATASETTQDAKMGPGASNTLANSRTQPETPGMQNAGAHGALERADNPSGQVSDSQKDIKTSTGEGGPDAPKNAPASYGGNFGNSVQDIFDDPDRLENQLSGPARGEFGSHGSGTTQGGYGNQYRADDTYAGHLGTQHASSGGYQGGRAENNTSSLEQEPGTGFTLQPDNSTFGTQPGTPLTGTTVDPQFHNDNASPHGESAGYSADYGHTSLGGAQAPAQPAAAEVGDGQRNQREDYIPSQTDSDRDGLAFDAQPVGTAQRQAADNGGRDEPGPAGAPETPAPGPDPASRTGYTDTKGQQSYTGNSSQGVGSRGGSYNDPNDNQAGTDTDKPSQESYGRAADNQAPVPPKPADDSDYGAAPRRNAGRDNDEARS